MFLFCNEPPPVALDARISHCSLNLASLVFFWEYVPILVCMFSVGLINIIIIIIIIITYHLVYALYLCETYISSNSTWGCLK